MGHGRTNPICLGLRGSQDPGLSVLKLGQSWANQDGCSLYVGVWGFLSFFLFSISFSFSFLLTFSFSLPLPPILSFSLLLS